MFNILKVSLEGVDPKFSRKNKKINFLTGALSELVILGILYRNHGSTVNDMALTFERKTLEPSLIAHMKALFSAVLMS